MGMNPMMGMGMNPMMAAMMRPGMGMNPMMMGMNPMMMAAMQSGMANMIGSGDSTAASQTIQETPEAAIDSRVLKLCRAYGIDDKITKKLNAALLTREDFDLDMQALWMIMEKSVAKNKRPLDVILVKMREIMKGDFPGKDLLEPGIKAFYQKYDLDDRTLNRLINILKMRGSKRDQDLRDIDGRLSSSGIKAPGGLLVRMLDGLEEFGRIPSPPRRLGGSGVSNRNFLGGRESASAGDRERGRDRRSRSRGRR
mmetsp:Transcript_44577/g.96980  ORF Transcript_44577/g.96980 Transcript_44577/m.96980 type:complete len:254 (-) Transcript_44577:3-764(-)